MTDVESLRFTGLYQEFYPRVLAYALRRAAPEVAREAADETFLIAWQRWDAVPMEAALPWLLVVARNIIYDQHRRGRRQDALTVEIANASFGLSEPGPDAAVVERMTVLTALAQLSVSDRDVLFLTVWDGLNNRDAATVAGCSAATFAVRLYRARRRLADALQRLDSGSSGLAWPVQQSQDTAPPSRRHHLDRRPLMTSKEERR